MVLDLQGDVVDSGHRIGALTEPLGDVFQPDLCHAPNGSLRAMDESIPADTSTAAGAVDLDGIGRDLADVEVALSRLDAGTYWTDEVTGEPLPTELLEQHPAARRA